MRVVSTGRKGYFDVDGKAYELPNAQFRRFAPAKGSAASAATLQGLGVDPGNWVKNVADAGTVLVHPRLYSLSGPYGAMHTVEDEAVIRRSASDPLSGFVSLREYVVGDDPRLVHWPTSARMGTLMIREHVELRARFGGAGLTPGVGPLSLLRGGSARGRAGFGSLFRFPGRGALLGKSLGAAFGFLRTRPLTTLCSISMTRPVGRQWTATSPMPIQHPSAVGITS